MKIKRNNILLSSTSICSLALVSLLSMPAHAEGGSVHHSGQASKHSVLAVTHGAGDSTKVASAIVAAPLILAGGVSVATGNSNIAMGESLVNRVESVSSYGRNAPLEITEVIITADPAPNKVVNNSANKEVIKTTTEVTTTELTQTKITKEQH